jgi:hypothetical protein
VNEWRSFQEVLSTRRRADFVGRGYEIETFNGILAGAPAIPLDTSKPSYLAKAGLAYLAFDGDSRR